MSYEDLLIEAEKENLTVKELPLESGDGRIKGKRIAIRQDIPTLAQKADVLAEELGHYYTATGDILDQTNIANRKQERAGRFWAYNKRIGLTGIVSAYKAGCRNSYEIADHLDVSEDTLLEALECYHQVYGRGEVVDNWILRCGGAACPVWREPPVRIDGAT